MCYDRGSRPDACCPLFSMTRRKLLPDGSPRGLLSPQTGPEFRRILMNQNDNNKSMERRLYFSFLLLAAILLVSCLLISMAISIRRAQRDLDQRISDTAAFIAELPEVQKMLQTGYPDKETLQKIDLLVADSSGVEAVMIANTNGLRFYQTDRHVVGDTYVDGDEKAILNGSEPYITTVYGTIDRQHCAFHAIRNQAGAITGFVMVSVPSAQITVEQRELVLLYLFLLAIMLVLASLITRAFLRFQRNALMGYRPGELLSLYIRQDVVINSLSEGLISTDRNGRILFSNAAARKLVTENDEIIAGKQLKDVFPETQFDRVMKERKVHEPDTRDIGDRTVLVSEVPLNARGRQPEGVLVILQDRTEALKLSDELSGARNMMDTLRAFNHEFLNKLHIILGYLQTGEIEKAKRFITNSSLVSSQAVRDTANMIRVSRVCALVIGKMMHAAELGIRLTVQPDSGMLEQDLILSQEEYVTIIGNLLENAIEELNADDAESTAETAGADGVSSAGTDDRVSSAGTDPADNADTAEDERPREIVLGIYCRPEVSIITCEDTGGGVQEDVLPRIFEKGVTTKGENHGTGLYLVKQIVDSRNGEISVDTEPGEGTCFTVTFTAAEGAGTAERTEEER